MPTKIDIVAHNPLAILLLNAMSALRPGGDLLEHFRIIPGGGDTQVDVCITVNGVEVDVQKELVAWVGQLDSSFDDAVLEAAKDLLSGDELLRNLQSQLADAQWRISDRIEALMKQSKENT